MNLTTYILSAVVGATLGAAQCTITSAIPTCGVSCINSAATAIGCATTDYDCQCTSSDQLQSSAEDCVISACGVVTALEVASAAEAICTACT